jgi:hypothetical protein
MKMKVLAGQSLEGMGKEQLETLQRDLREQETLISGYQQVWLFLFSIHNFFSRNHRI